MESRSVFLTCFLIPLCIISEISSQVISEPYDFLFDTAVDAYYKNDWISVILNMEKALRNNAAVRKAKVQCRISCANQTTFGEPTAGLGDPTPGAESVEDLVFFQKILKRADCVNSCETEKLGPATLHKIGDDVKLEFKKRTPYNYLQVAYFKINKLDKAVAAAHTFFLANPDHVEMKQNLDYYKMMAGVREEDFKDLEARPHMAEFLLGKRYYSDDSFGLAAEHFEVAVQEYFQADRECRFLCEGSYDYDGYNYMDYSADLFQSMTDHYMQVLSCKQRCSVELATTAGLPKPFEDFLPAHFNYLQFSYYNSEKYEKAIECAKTFLMFHPEDEVMTQNLAYYSAVLGDDLALTLTPRQVVKQHMQQSLLEKELLYYGYEVFGLAFVDPDTWTPVEIMPQKLREKQKTERETAARITEEIGNLMKEIENLVEEKNKDSSDINKMPSIPEGGPVLYQDIQVSMTSKQLNGSQRVLLDGVISDDECRELHRLSNSAAQRGDGYRGRPSPHSPNELFQGVTVLRAVKLAQEGKVPLKSARLFFDMSEKVRKVLESYFRLETPLYFSYSHLVCRSAVEETQEDRTDPSHAVHVDNCVLVSESNECIKEPPAYTHRDYSAILYLNDDFEGGDFIFTMLDGKTVTAEVRPRCGRVVGFGSGKENPHGVRAVTRGQRCAVALWFTLDPVHDEKERIQAQDMLTMFSMPVDHAFTGTGAKELKATAPTEASPPKDPEPMAAEPTDPPRDLPMDTPKDMPQDPPMDTPKDLPMDTPKYMPQDTPMDTPTEEKEELVILPDAQVEKPADTQKEKADEEAASHEKESKVKTVHKTKPKAGNKAKAKTGNKVKDQSRTKVEAKKQPAKTKDKQATTKGSKAPVKKTTKSSTKDQSKKSVDDESEKDKDEL
ncbi:prolyl 3-hydroxylase 1 [Gadus morhua]|uniref:procollagen-proline 3-dioxygenase n=1 Tax=Gadus morhua TaxID=8049 RepID=A0A8C5BSU3_GADMO|nr:prolyl 3-hydroxylase 1 [Gadus morhua]